MLKFITTMILCNVLPAFMLQSGQVFHVSESKDIDIS